MTRVSTGVGFVLTAVSCSSVRLSLTPVARRVEFRAHEAEPLPRVQNMSSCLSIQALFSLNWIRSRSVVGCGSDPGPVRRQGAVGAVRRVMEAVEDVFGQVLVVEGGIPREMVGQGWSLRLDRSQTLALRPETQIKQIFWLNNDNKSNF